MRTVIPPLSRSRSHRRCSAYFAIGLKLALQAQTARPSDAQLHRQRLARGHSRFTESATLMHPGDTA
jgi:hypothetical protein